MRILLLAFIFIALGGCVSTDDIFSENTSSQTKKRGATSDEHFMFMAGELDDEAEEKVEVRIIEHSSAQQDAQKRIVKVTNNSNSVNDDNMMLMDTDSYAMPFVASETEDASVEKAELETSENTNDTSENVTVWVTKGNAVEANVAVEIESSSSGQVLEKKVVVVTADETDYPDKNVHKKVSTEMSDIIIKLIQTANLTDAEKARVKAALTK